MRFCINRAIHSWTRTARLTHGHRILHLAEDCEMLRLMPDNMHDLKKITGFPLNDFCVNHEVMRFLKIGNVPINTQHQYLASTLLSVVHEHLLLIHVIITL